VGGGSTGGARPTESVWDYPRPPRLEMIDRRIRIELGGETIVDTTRAARVLETSHPPAYYVPPEEFAPGALRPARGSSLCEYKGRAAYHDVLGGGRIAPRAAWSYPEPTPAYAAIAGWVTVYPGRMDRCLVDDDVVTPQAGDFYGGWITPEITGPFKGGPGTAGW
jgi:uncharacterized protein (DUF427 family)